MLVTTKTSMNCTSDRHPACPSRTRMAANSSQPTSTDENRKKQNNDTASTTSAMASACTTQW